MQEKNKKHHANITSPSHICMVLMLQNNLQQKLEFPSTATMTCTGGGTVG